MTETKNIQAVAMIADHDDHRPAFQSIYFTGSEAVATDGFILARTKSDIPEQKRDALPYQKINGYSSVNADGSITLKSKLSDNESRLEPKIIDVEYPQYQRVIPQEGQNNHLRIGLGVAVLEKLVKSMKKTDAQYVELQFSADNLKPIIGKCGDVEYIIMPMRINN